MLPEAEADQGVAPVIVVLVVLKTDGRRYVTKRDLVKYEYTAAAASRNRNTSNKKSSNKQQNQEQHKQHKQQPRKSEGQEVWV